jgi:hypothetical protein
VNNIWSFGGRPGDSDRTNQLFLNPFFNYHFASGWSVGSSPEITANWILERREMDRPGRRRLRQGVLPRRTAMKLDFKAFYNAYRSKAGNDTWLLQVKLTFQFPD